MNQINLTGQGGLVLLSRCPALGRETLPAQESSGSCEAKQEIGKEKLSDPEAKVRHQCGATSSDCGGIDQIPFHALIALGHRYKVGEIKHGRGNWKQGLGNKSYTIERLGHVIKHAAKAIAILQGDIKDDGDDNGAAIMWGGAFVVESLRTMREAKRCHACGGVGLVNTIEPGHVPVPCPACKGTGVLK